MNNAEAAIPQGRTSRVNKEQQKKQKIKQSHALKPEQFQTKKGIKALYQKTKALQLNEFSDVNIENTMKKIVTALKTWHFEFMPKYSFEYFLQRCQALGNHKLMSAYMSKVRRIHKGNDQWDQIQPATIEVNQPLINPEQAISNNNFQEDLNMLNGMNNRREPQGQFQDDQQDDDNLMEMMYEAQKKAENKRQDKMEFQEQPYVPEGFQHNFSEQDD